MALIGGRCGCKEQGAITLQLGGKAVAWGSASWEVLVCCCCCSHNSAGRMVVLVVAAVMCVCCW